jgi:hypothetical protein
MKTSHRLKTLSRETQLKQARRIASVLAALSVLVGQEIRPSRAASSAASSFKNLSL